VVRKEKEEKQGKKSHKEKQVKMDRRRKEALS